eukprot:2916105-Amphidinium_carterae.2
MERRALYETIQTKSWRTAKDPGRSLQNPDEYPWPQRIAELENCTNNDPRKGRCSRDVWHAYWNRQTELICETPPPPEVEEAGLHRCYVCKETPHHDVKLQRCLLCKTVYMCRNHWLRLACLDNYAVREFPVRLPRQEWWQDVDDIIIPDNSITYCPCYSPDNIDRDPPPSDLLIMAREDKNRRGGVLVLSVGTNESEHNMTRLWQSHRADRDTRHMAEYVKRYPITDPECEGMARLYPAARPRAPIGLGCTPYPWFEEENDRSLTRAVNGATPS